MEIVIKGAQWTPEWETLQSMLIQATGAASGKLTRISREDGKCDYRAPGVYNLTFLKYGVSGGLGRMSEEVAVKLTVER